MELYAATLGSRLERRPIIEAREVNNAMEVKYRNTLEAEMQTCIKLYAFHPLRPEAQGRLAHLSHTASLLTTALSAEDRYLLDH